MLLEELLKIAADPHLIASAKQANLLLAELQGYISELRADVSQLELEADLHHNKLMQQEKSIALKESEYKISKEYREWQAKKGLLTDVRAVRRNLERHTDLLIQQEKFRPYGSYERAA